MAASSMMDPETFNTLQDTLVEVFARAKKENNDALVVAAANGLIALETYRNQAKQTNTYDNREAYNKLKLGQ